MLREVSMPTESDESEQLAKRVLELLKGGERAVKIDGGILKSLRTQEKGDLDCLDRDEEPSTKSLSSNVNVMKGGETVGALLSGSFAPLHVGHRKMRQVAQRWLRIPVHFELSVQNADKPTCSIRELGRRLAQFSPQDAVWITQLPTFHDKTVFLRPRWFVVGVDTMRRIADLRFYDMDEARFDAAVRTWNSAGTRFLVLGRIDGTGFQELEQLRLPSSLLALCEGLSQQEFREDISSTQLREAGEW